MAAEGGGKEMNEIKTQFTTREGAYKLLSHSEYSRPNRVPFNSQGSNPVKVSFVNVNDQSGNGDRICFNVGRELYFYIYKGVRKVNSSFPVLLPPGSALTFTPGPRCFALTRFSAFLYALACC